MQRRSESASDIYMAVEDTAVLRRASSKHNTTVDGYNLAVDITIRL